MKRANLHHCAKSHFLKKEGYKGFNILNNKGGEEFLEICIVYKRHGFNVHFHFANQATEEKTCFEQV